MRNVLISLTLLLLLIIPLTRADIGPKPSVDIILVDSEGNPLSEGPFRARMLGCFEKTNDYRDYLAQQEPTKLDNISIFERERGCTWSPAYFAWGGDCQNSKCGFGYMPPSNFRLAVLLSGEDRIYISNEVTTQNFDSSFKATLMSDGTIYIEETTSAFNSDFITNFIIALILTLIIEIAVAILFMREWNLGKNLILVVIIGNIITLPIVHFILPMLITLASLNVIISLTFAILLESAMIFYVFRREITFNKALIISIGINIASFIVGSTFWLIYWLGSAA